MKIVAGRGVYHTEDEDSQWKGFGGRKWIIEFFDGKRITTTNLFCDRGAKDDEPDNARLLSEAGKPVGWIEVGPPGSIYTHAFGELPND